MLSKVKLFGHPVHPMLVAYPVACYTGTLVGYVLYAATGEQFWLRFAIALNVAGVAMAAVAALPGFIDWAAGIPAGSAAKRTGLRHMTLNVVALAFFTIAMIMYLDEWSATGEVGATAGILLSAIGMAFTLGAGFFGWMMVQDHHVGVNLTPEQARIDEQAQDAYRHAS